MSNGCKPLAWVVMGCLAAWSAIAVADEEPAALTPEKVVEMVTSMNPSVKAALADCRSAEMLVVSEGARNGFVFSADTAYTHSASPTLYPPNMVVTGNSDIVESGVALSKRFSAGTEVALRVELYAQHSDEPVIVPPSLLNALGLEAGPEELVLGPGYGDYLRLSVKQPLLRGAGADVVLADLNAARAKASVAALAKDARASEVLRDALSAYWELWHATNALRIERQARETAIAERDDVQGRVKKGSVSIAESLSFETQVAARDEDVANAEMEYAQRSAELSRLLGERGAVVDLDRAPQGNEVSGDLVAEAMTVSPEVRTRTSELSAVRVVARTAADAFRPRLDIDAYVQAQGLGYEDPSAALRQTVGVGAVSGHAGLTFELPLDDARHRAERTRAELAVEAAQQRLDEVRLGVSAAVTSERSRYESSLRRVGLAKETLALARQKLTSEEERYRTGGSTAVAVLQANDDVRSVELRLSRAQTDVVTSYLALEHLVGQLLARILSDAQRASIDAHCMSER